jgi:hypothetical protein
MDMDQVSVVLDDVTFFGCPETGTIGMRIRGVTVQVEPAFARAMATALMQAANYVESSREMQAAVKGGGLRNAVN